jgi:hypothetical protein
MSNRQHRRNRRIDHARNNRELARGARANGHYHRTIDEAGQCACCAAENKLLLSDAPRRFVLEFMTTPEPGQEGRRVQCSCCDEWVDVGPREAIAIIPGYTDDTLHLAENASAVGANPGGNVSGFEIPLQVVLACDIPECELIYEPDATAVLAVLGYSGDSTER